MIAFYALNALGFYVMKKSRSCETWKTFDYALVFRGSRDLLNSELMLRRSTTPIVSTDNAYEINYSLSGSDD